MCLTVCSPVRLVDSITPGLKKESRKSRGGTGLKKFSLSFLKVFLLYQSKVSILGPVGYGPTRLPLRHSNLLEKKMNYCDLCSRVIYGYYLPIELVCLYCVR